MMRNFNTAVAAGAVLFGAMATDAKAAPISFNEGVFPTNGAVAIGPYKDGVSISGTTGASSVIRGPGGSYAGYDDSYYLEVPGGSSVTFAYSAGSMGYFVWARPLAGALVQWDVSLKNGATNIGSTTSSGGPDINWYEIESDPTTPFTTAILSCFGVASKCGFDVANGGIEIAKVPEPASLALLGVSVAGIGAYRRHRRTTPMQERLAPVAM